MSAPHRYFDLTVDEDVLHWSALDWINADIWPGGSLPDVSSVWSRAEEVPKRARDLFGEAARFGGEDRAIALWQRSEAYKTNLHGQEAAIISALDGLLNLARPVRVGADVAEMTEGLRRTRCMIERYREDLVCYHATLAIGHLHWTGSATDDLALITTPGVVCALMQEGDLTTEKITDLKGVFAAYRNPMVGLAEIEAQLDALQLREPFGVRYDPLFFILESGTAERILDDQYRQQTGGRPQGRSDAYYGPCEGTSSFPLC